MVIRHSDNGDPLCAKNAVLNVLYCSQLSVDCVNFENSWLWEFFYVLTNMRCGC